MRVTVVGSGYVGLVAAAGLAHLGHSVTVIEIEAQRVARLAEGHVRMTEADLPGLVRAGLNAGRLRFTTDPSEAADAEIALIAVGTPSRSDGAADLSALHAAVGALVGVLGPDAVIAVKSTAPPGTAAALAATHRRPIATNPEFLREGTAVGDFLTPERVVLGADDPASIRALRALYAPLDLPPDRVLVMDPTSAELTKYACNTMLAARVALVNELARLAEATGADIDHVRAGLATDARIGPHFLDPSLGFGGSCLPDDVRALAAAGRAHGVQSPVVDAVVPSNRLQTDHVLGLLAQHLGGLAGRRVAVWGLAFKAGTDDVRESAAVALAARAADAGSAVTVHDPVAMPNARRVLGDRVTWATSAEAALVGADALVVATEWPVYAGIGADAFHRMRGRLIVDGRNLLDPPSGFTTVALGRPVVRR